MYWDSVYFDREESLAPNGMRVVPPGYYVLGYEDVDDEYPTEVYAISAVQTDGGIASDAIARQVAAQWNKVPNPGP